MSSPAACRPTPQFGKVEYYWRQPGVNIPGTNPGSELGKQLFRIGAARTPRVVKARSRREASLFAGDLFAHYGRGPALTKTEIVGPATAVAIDAIAVAVRDALDKMYSATDGPLDKLWTFMAEALDWQRRALEQIAPIADRAVRFRSAVELRPLTPAEIADEAICLFLEYRDDYGYDEQQAKAKAIQEVFEGLDGVRP